MTGRVVRIELRRAATKGAAVISVPLVLFGFTDTARAFNIVVSGQRQLMLLFLSLALGVGSWQALRDRRSKMDELLATTPRQRRSRALPTAIAMAAGAAGGSWVVLGGLAICSAVLGGYLSWGSLPIVLIASVFLVCAVWLGLAVGTLLPWRLTPPLLVIVAFAAGVSQEIVLETPDDAPSGLLLMMPSATQGFGEFTVFTARANTVQAWWAIALAAFALVLYLASTLLGRALALVPLVLGVAIVSPLAPDLLTEAVVIDAGAVAAVCTPDQPRVCVLRVHQAGLADLREPGRQALGILSAKLPQAPSQVQERYWRADTASDAEILYLDLWTDTWGRFPQSPEYLMWTLLFGAGTMPCADAPAYPSPERARYDAARVVAAAWLLEKDPPVRTSFEEMPWLPDVSLTGPVLQTLRGLPAPEQRARVTAFREAELACGRGDRLAILTGEPGPA